MKTIYDPASRWLDVPPQVLAPSNKKPVALDDTLIVPVDGGPVSVDVLANDFDPEGQALTLVSASAALGMAVAQADNTVTYTPPSGLSGFDTVVYEVADDLGQISAGQINVTIQPWQLSIDLQPDNTLVVNAETGLLDIVVIAPAEVAGSYQVATADLAGGPVCLVPPSVSGTADIGALLSADPGLWVYDTSAGPPVASWQWQRAGADISGATGATYTTAAADNGRAITLRQTLTDAAGQRSATSAAIQVGFSPAGDPQAIGWWDAADPGTITANAGFVTAWADKTGGTPLAQATGGRQPVTGIRQLNGLNVIDFDGNHFLARALSLPPSGNVAFHMVLGIDSVISAFAAVLAVEAGNDFQLDANNSVQFGGRLNAAGIGPSATLSGGPFSGAIILSMMFDRTGAATATVYIGGVSRAATGYTVPIDTSAALHVMCNRSANAWVNGAVAELVITEDLANRADYHSYLATKWGLA